MARAAALLPLVSWSVRAQAPRLAVLAGDSVIQVGSSAVVARANAPLAATLHWRPVRGGVHTATLELRAGDRGVAVQAILLRVDPAQLRFALQHGVADNGMTGTWTTDSAGPAAVVAMNAGQFRETGPWGWLVMHGEELRSPGRAPLAAGCASTPPVASTG